MRWAEAQKHGEIRLLTPLPRMVRFRLWREHGLNRLGAWLCKWKRSVWLAEVLWRVFGRSNGG